MLNLDDRIGKIKLAAPPLSHYGDREIACLKTRSVELTRSNHSSTSSEELNTSIDMALEQT